MILKKLTPVLSILFLSVLATTFQGCGSDDEAPPKNEFTVGDETFTLTNGFLESFEDTHPVTEEPVYNWSVYMQSDPLKPTWHWVRFNLYSDNETAPTPGTYTYDDESSMDNFTFFFGEVMTNYVLSSGDGDGAEDFESGTVTVAKNGDKHTITWDVTLAGGTKVKGSFTGVFEQ